jgi:hypothetical protein
MSTTLKSVLTDESTGKQYEADPATIRSTRLSLGGDDHGIITAYVHVEGRGWGVGLGGYCLDAPVKDADGKFIERVGTGYGLDHLAQFVKTVGVDTWEQLPGKQVLVLFDPAKGRWGYSAVGVASYDGERIFDFKDHAEAWKDRQL